MDKCLLYIFIIFLISFLICIMIRDNKNVIEGLSTSILKYTMNDLNAGADPEKAGSIEQKYSDDKQKENDLNYKIYNPDELFNLMKLNKNFQEEKKPREKKKINPYEKKSGYSPSEYSPYEKILPPMEFIKESKVKDISKINIYERDTRQDFSYNTERILGIDDLDTANDCMGIWGEWDESWCDDSKKRCSIKFRTFNVKKPAKPGGKDCHYAGDVIADGNIEYDYCYGSGHKDRCGFDENVCSCDLDNYDSDLCIFESYKRNCECDKKDKHIFPDTGKCTSSTGIPALGTGNGFSSEQRAEILVMLDEWRRDIDTAPAIGLLQIALGGGLDSEQGAAEAEPASAAEGAAAGAAGAPAPAGL